MRRATGTSPSARDRAATCHKTRDSKRARVVLTAAMRSIVLLASGVSMLTVLAACRPEPGTDDGASSSNDDDDNKDSESEDEQEDEEDEGDEEPDDEDDADSNADSTTGGGDTTTGGSNPTTTDGSVTQGVTSSTDPSAGDSNTGDTEGPGPVEVDRECPAYEGLIADFEEGSAMVLPIEGRMGRWDPFNDDAGTRVDEIVQEGTDLCNSGVYHTSGSGYTSYVGLGTTVTSTGLVTNSDGTESFPPAPYDAKAQGYVGISFRAKAGPGQATPVRLAVSTPWTEGGEYTGATCTDEEGSTTPCWNHPGHFLSDAEALGSDWQTYTFCFDRDFHPEWLPTGDTAPQRLSLGSALLGIQFKFNQSFDPQGDTVPKTGSFDFYLDDVKFVTSGCDKPIFASTGGATDPFGTNEAIGSCILPTNVGAYNAQITEAYERWKNAYVANDGGVIDPQTNNRVVSEAIGYGMLITAAMGDKETFDRIWGWATSRGAPGTLLGWENGSGGSATDADTDMAYALLMAGKQWGGEYASQGNTLASVALMRDTVASGSGRLLIAGESYTDRVNPSYFSPGFYRAYSSDWSSVISTTQGVLQTCSNGFGGLLPDWCTTSGTPDGAGSAQQTAPTVCTGTGACLAYDGARVPWRLGFDACVGGDRSLLESFMNNLYSKDPALQNGSRIDLLSAGWSAEGPNATGVDNPMAFIGPVGVGAMGMGDQEALDRAFIATLDILERPEYYGTYFETTVALLSLLTMSGNWPTP